MLDYLDFVKRLKLERAFSDDDNRLLELYEGHPVPMELEPVHLATPDESKEHDRFLYTQVTTKELNHYNDFVQRVIKRWEEQLREMIKGVTSIESEDKETNFDLVAIKMAQREIGFCCDPYYLTPARSRLVGVLPLGRVMSLGCKVAGSSIRDFFNQKLVNSLNWHEELSNWLEQEPQRGCQIRLLGETAATSDILPYLSGNTNVKKNVNMDTFKSKEELQGWVGMILNKDPEERWIVIADLDILRSIKVEKDLKLPFRDKSGYRAGFAYPLGEDQWRRRAAIAMAVAEVLVRGGAPDDEWGKVKSNLIDVGIEPLENDELLRELLLDMNRDDAVRWRRRLEKLAPRGKLPSSRGVGEPGAGAEVEEAIVLTG